MKTIYYYYDFTEFTAAIKFREFCSDLENLEIHVKHIDLRRMSVETDHCYIRFVKRDPRDFKTAGVRSDIVLGCNESESVRHTWTHTDKLETRSLIDIVKDLEKEIRND